MTARKLGQMLARWRAASRLSQTEVAKRSGLVQHQISRLEHGQIERPAMEDIVRLIQIYGVSPNEVATIFGWVPPKSFQSDDYRWQFVQDFLAHATDAQRDRLLQELYDRTLFIKELDRRDT